MSENVQNNKQNMILKISIKFITKSIYHLITFIVCAREEKSDLQIDL